MRPRALLILVPLAVLSLAAGWYLDIAAAPGVQTAAENGRLMFPGLTPQLEQAAEIQLVHGATTLRLVKDKATGAWGIAERGGYPADAGKLHALLTGLTELRLMERRTADPALFPRLGVEDPTGKDATSTLVRIVGADGKPIAEVIAGHTRTRTGGNLPEQVYVRRPGQEQSWLAEGRLDLDADPLSWLDRDIMDIKPPRIAEVAVTTPNGHLVLARSGGKLAMQEPADHPPLDTDRLDDVQHALELLTLQDVRRAAEAPKGQSLGSAVFDTTDGLAITATAEQAGKDLWVSFAAAAAPGAKDAKAAADAAAKLDARLKGWEFQLGSWKRKALVPALDDLKAAPPATPAPASPPAASPAPKP
ncbi:MAG: DUF4340 domain-containing protein [Proteobacteria bacterium]|nr:DUF4340 domain-containing protein [Pseudomonadota bacterium]